MSNTNTFEDPTTNHNRIGRIILAGKILGVAAVAAAAGVAYRNSENYGYHPDQNPKPPTYLDTHPGNPADIIRDNP